MINIGNIFNLNKEGNIYPITIIGFNENVVYWDNYYFENNTQLQIESDSKVDDIFGIKITKDILTKTLNFESSYNTKFRLKINECLSIHFCEPSFEKDKLQCFIEMTQENYELNRVITTSHYLEHIIHLHDIQNLYHILTNMHLKINELH